jgi:type IV secretory pathway ATPase VirB11/archaellum biosynthesis ATPase
MRFTCEMLSVSPDGTLAAYPNKLTITEHNGRVFVEVSAVHDGHQVVSTVVVERVVFAYHIKASGILS